MTDLATVADLEAHLGRTMSGQEATRAGAILADTSASVRGYTGQDFTQASTTDVVRVRRGRALLPQRPVDAVDAVTDLDGHPVPSQWLGNDVIDLLGNGILADGWAIEPWSTPLGAVVVTYTHGYDEVPADIVGVTCSVTLRALGTDPLLGGRMQESIGGYFYSTGPTGAAGGFGLLNDERAVLDRYRRIVGTVSVGRW